MSSYVDYIRGGEFLIAPSLNCKEHYILKCSECEEFYDDMDALFYHCLNHYQCKSTNDSNEAVDDLNSGDEDNPINDIGISIMKCEKLLKTEDEGTIIGWDCFEADDSAVFQERDETTCNEYGSVEKIADVPDNSNADIVEPKTEISCTEPSKSGSFVRNFMKTRENVSALIEAYKRQPKLWNSSFSRIKYQERNSILKDIAKDIKCSVNIDLPYAQVAAIIAHVRYTYRAKVQRKHLKVWYFEHLDFLKPYIEIKTMPAQIQSEKDILERYLPDMSQEHLTHVLGVYKRHPILWNTEMAENCCENKRNEAFEEMLNEIAAEISLQFDQDKLKECIESIHSCVAKLKYRKITKQKTIASENCTQMKFLFDHVGPFACSECGRKLKSALAFRIHLSKHDGSVPLVCSICKKGFRVISTYISHVRRHNEDLQSECAECGKKFLRSYDLDIHMRCHTGVKPFCCELCGISFRHIQTFASHKRKHEQNFLHRCSICSKGFYAKAKLDDHVRTHTNIREFACATCGKAFKTKKTLSQHLAIHEDARKHACPLCGKTFKLKVGVNQHMRTHGSNIDKSLPAE